MFLLEVTARYCDCNNTFLFDESNQRISMSSQVSNFCNFYHPAPERTSYYESKHFKNLSHGIIFQPVFLLADVLLAEADVLPWLLVPGLAAPACSLSEMCPSRPAVKLQLCGLWCALFRINCESFTPQTL